MQKAQTGAGSRRRPFLLLSIPLVLLLAWQGALLLARSCSNERIQRSVGQALPAFTLADRDGVAWTAAALRGRQVVLHFFRSQCEACDAEAPEFVALEQQVDPAAVQVLHVMTDRVLGFDPQLTERTLMGKGFRRPVLMADQAFVDAFHSVTFAQVTPVTYLVDASGNIAHALRGRQTAARVRELLATLR